MVKVRINKYDNLKGLAILLIVFWHLRSMAVFPEIIMKFVFLIALPIFFFVAGRFSKTTPDQPYKIVKRLLVPYLVFTLIFKLFKFILTGSITFDLIFIQPTVALWFLLALFLMKMTLPVVEKLRYPLITVTVIALLAGYLNKDFSIFALQRFFGYFPIFLLGYNYESYREKLTELYPKLCGFYDKYFIAIFALTIIVCFVLLNWVDEGFITFTKEFGKNVPVDMLKRFTAIMMIFIIVPMISRAMTNKETFLTKFGKNSMAVYLFHVFALITITSYTREYIVINPLVTVIFSLVLAFAVTFVFSRDVVTKYLNMFTDSIAKLLLKPIE